MIHWQSVKFPAVWLDVQPPWHGERYLGMVFLTFTLFFVRRKERISQGDYMTESDPQTGSKEMAGQSQAALQSDFTVVMVALVVIPA